jgi:hypothetical protein
VFIKGISAPRHSAPLLGLFALPSPFFTWTVRLVPQQVTQAIFLNKPMPSPKPGFLRLLLLAFLINILAQAIHETGHLIAYQAYGRNPTWGFIGLVQRWSTPPEYPEGWVQTRTPEGEIGWLRLDLLPTEKSEIAIIGAAGPLASLLVACSGLFGAYKYKNEEDVFKYIALMLALSTSLVMALYYLRSPFRVIGDEYDLATYPLKKPGQISEVCVEQENALDSNFGNLNPQNIEMIPRHLFWPCQKCGGNPAGVGLPHLLWVGAKVVRFVAGTRYVVRVLLFGERFRRDAVNGFRWMGARGGQPGDSLCSTFLGGFHACFDRGCAGGFIYRVMVKTRKSLSVLTETD